MPPGYANIPAEPGAIGDDCLKHVPAVGRPSVQPALSTLTGSKALVVAGGAGLIAGGGAFVGGGFAGGGGFGGSGAAGIGQGGGGPTHSAGGGTAPGGSHTSPGGPGGGTVPIPEPASLVLFGVAAAALLFVRLRRSR